MWLLCSRCREVVSRHIALWCISCAVSACCRVCLVCIPCCVVACGRFGSEQQPTGTGASCGAVRYPACSISGPALLVRMEGLWGTPSLQIVICCAHHPPSIPRHLKCLSRRSAVLQVVVCSNHVSAQEEINHALTHELIHAYDHCRAADLDWTNCEHHACSEVRQSFQSPTSWTRCGCLESKLQLVPPYSDPCTACKGS